MFHSGASCGPVDDPPDSTIKQGAEADQSCMPATTEDVAAGREVEGCKTEQLEPPPREQPAMKQPPVEQSPAESPKEKISILDLVDKLFPIRDVR